MRYMLHAGECTLQFEKSVNVPLYPPTSLAKGSLFPLPVLLAIKPSSQCFD